jgi:hypothetical protein
MVFAPLKIISAMPHAGVGSSLRDHGRCRPAASLLN